MPSGLLAKHQQRWNALWSSPLVRVLVPELDIDAIETLFRARDERDRAWQAGRRNRLVAGRYGQPVLNPLFACVQQMQPQIQASEDRLAANPKARLILGVLFGDAHRSVEDINDDLEADPNLGDLLHDADVLGLRTAQES